jgi:SAM-dependent methyltransferase
MNASTMFRALGRTLKNPRYLGHIFRKLRVMATRDSIFHAPDELAMAGACPSAMLEVMLEIFRPKSILDVGQGTGQAIAFFTKKGMTDVLGVEGSAEAIAASPFPEKAMCWNLDRPLDLHRRFDVVYSFEVAEHIHPRYVDNLLQTFSAHGDRVVMTAARAGQGGLGHFNEQPPEYWIRQFARFGFRYDAENTQRLKDCKDIWWENILVFVRDAAPSRE